MLAQRQPANDSVPARPRCPVCASADTGSPLFRYTAREAADYFCPPTRNADRNARLARIIDRLWGGADCRVHRCEACGFAFSDPFVGGDEEFYATLHEQHGYPAWRWDYDVALAVAARSAPSRLLDVGAGVGVFLAKLPSGWEGAAVEGSETTRSILRDRGIPVHGDIEQAARAEVGRYALVTAFQVLEHLADFRGFLRASRTLLAPGRTLVISVPDGDAMLRQPALTGQHDMPPNHVAKWTPNSLAAALREQGFVPGPAVREPVTWRHLTTALHGRLTADAVRPHSLAAQAYRVGDRRLRIPLLALCGVIAAPRLLPHLGALLRSTAFAMTATKAR
jgi:SAM-dependent methyltransferase